MINGNSPGNGDVTINVLVTERLAAHDPPTSRKDNIPFQTRSYDMSAAWEADVYTCNPHAIPEIVEAVAAISHEVFVLLNTPDPSPEPIFRIASAAQRYVRALQSATKGSIGLRNSIAAAASPARGSFDEPATLDQLPVTGGLPARVRIVPVLNQAEASQPKFANIG
jgi:hypothetical protein